MKIYILIPRLDNNGPVKGAIALANGLRKKKLDVTLMPLYHTSKSKSIDNVSLDLTQHQFFLEKIREFKKIIKNRIKSEKVVIISYCFQPDLLVLLSGFSRIAISSLRGNLVKNYFADYGFIGKIMAVVHYWVSSRHAFCVVLNKTMLHSMRFYKASPVIIENFIDEPEIKYQEIQNRVKKFIFIGALSKRKAVLELVDCALELKKKDIKFKLDILGDGPEKQKVVDRIKINSLEKNINIVGHVDNPIDYLKSSDIFILPSHSEGTSRASMEALYCGLPCIMRDVDSNSELISSSKQGILCLNKKEIIDAMEYYSKRQLKRECLLSEPFRQNIGVDKYLILINKIL